MKNTFSMLASVTVGVLLGGCNTTTISETGNYWGNYAKTSYTVIADPSEENYEKHLEEMKRIVNESAELKLKVPPGIYAEIGYTYQRLGEPEQAQKSYALEAEYYPESSKLVDLLMSNSKPQESK